jgi:TonB-linked SusC/RagA family outer membrane protein
MLNQRALRDTYFYRKFFRIMRLTIAFLLLACLHVAATGHSQDKVTLNLKAVELRKAIIAIEKKTDYRFLFNEELLDHRPKIDVEVVETPVTEVLNQIFQNTGITYRILESKLVVLRESSESAGLATLQDIRVTGRVTSAEAGDALHGVSVSVKGSRTGTTTDATGNYAITVPDNATLVFSYVGYETKEVAVGGQSVVNVTLSQSVKVQEQVVVIGYGTASKRDLTGSIAKVSGKEVADKPNSNPISSLQGKVAGLSVVNSATPGSQPDIRIRGTISIGSVHPLYVVDGIFNDNIDYLNPNDIESIEVLKDPSSLAIFGVRGAAGVIAITTKKARAGQTVINLNSSIGSKKLVDKIQVANADQFKTLYNTQRQNSGQTPFDFGKWTGNTDWVDALTRNALININNLSVSTATDRNKFYFGLGYTIDQGVVKHVELQKVNVTVSDEVKLTNAIKLGFSVTELRQELPFDGDGYLADARRIAPVVNSGTVAVKVPDPYGKDSVVQNLYNALPVLQNTLANPLMQLENNWDKQDKIQFRTVGNVYADISFLKVFDFRSTFYGDFATRRDRTYTPLYYVYNPETQTAGLVNTRTGVSVSNTTDRKFQTDNILTYKQRFENHNLTALAGFTSYYTSHEYISNSVKQSLAGQPIPDDKRFWYIDNGFGDPTTKVSSSDQWEESTLSLLFRALYNYGSKYYLNVSFRRDGASQFYRYGKAWKNFYAVGAAWEVTKEDFFKNQKIFNFLKVKGSYGILGNSNTLGYHYPLYPNIIQGNSSVFGNNYPYNIVSSYSQAYLISPDLSWESVNSLEAGFEANFLDNRLHFEGVYYNKRTKDVLTVIPGISGTGDYLGNLGDIKNYGVELTASWTQQLTQDLKLNVGGNFTTIKNEVIKLSTTGYSIGPDEQVPSRTTAGNPIGYFYGYEVDGIYQSYTDIVRSSTLVGYTYGPGDFKFKDRNGDDKVDGSDRTMIGNPTPKFTYGASLGLNYKSFDLSVDVGGVYGNQIYRVWGTTENPYSQYNYPKDRIYSWSGAGTSNWEPILSNNNALIKLPSTYGIDDGSYFRIRNLQVGYNLPPKVISKAKIKNLRIFFNAQNLKTWKNNQGFSPEFGGSATQFGVDWGDAASALPRIIGGGINVTF